MGRRSCFDEPAGLTSRAESLNASERFGCALVCERSHQERPDLRYKVETSPEKPRSFDRRDL